MLRKLLQFIVEGANKNFTENNHMEDDSKTVGIYLDVVWMCSDIY